MQIFERLETNYEPKVSGAEEEEKQKINYK